jgi:hypothetical protein
MMDLYPSSLPKIAQAQDRAGDYWDTIEWHGSGPTVCNICGRATLKGWLRRRTRRNQAFRYVCAEHVTLHTTEAETL